MLAGLLSGANVLKGPVGKRRANCSERVCLRARWRVGRGACEWAERVERLHGSVAPIALKAFACEWSGGVVLGPRPISRRAHGALIVLGTRRYTSSGMLVSPGELACELFS